MVMEATGAGVTVSCALPLRPSLVAVIVAEPGATAAIVPLADTVAIALSDEVHETVRPVSTAPAAERSSAAAAPACPAASVVALSDTVTVDTGSKVGGVVVGVSPPPQAARAQATHRSVAATTETGR
jgi:hypothetical protein